MQEPTATLVDDKTAVLPEVFAPSDEVFAPGVAVGRFILLREIGSGGMGSVFAAYDERLDRQIAVKVVRSLVAGSEARARLLREARTLAQLAHPNVVAVYDAGEYAGQVYIAMELVSGDTLQTWLRASKRPWQEIVAVFIQAGLGLAAAHNLGIVHRDFKPANVIVGADGRVRVLDFGLAREGEVGSVEGEEDLGGASRSLSRRYVSEALTAAGSICGTPAYMAPEQLLGEPLDARTDVFALSVALYEALYGVRPFAASLHARKAELAELLLRSKAPSPPRSEVPGWLRAEVLRGLSLDPEKRHPTMDTLIAALSRDHGRRLRWLGLGLAGGLLAAGGYVAALEDDAATCEAETTELWSASAREAASTSLRAAGGPSAAIGERVLAALDTYTQRWLEVEIAACREHASGRHDAVIHGLQTSCLGERRDSFEALVDRVTAKSSPELVALALEAALDLPAPERCADVGALTATIAPPEDPSTALEVERIRRILASAKADLDVHRFAEGLALTEPLLQRAEATRYLPILAETTYVHGRLLESREDNEEAASTLRRALWLAERVRDDSLVARAMTNLIRVLGYAFHRVDEAHAFRDHAEALIYRLGDESREAGGLRGILGGILSEMGRDDEAEALLRQALADVTRHHSDDIGEARQARKLLALVARKQRRHAEAKALFLEHLSQLERLYGPEHPRLGEPLLFLSEIQLELGELSDALRTTERMAAIIEASQGPDHPASERARGQQSRLLAALGRPRESVASLDRLIDAMTRRDASAFRIAIIINTRGSVRGRYGDWEGALADFRESQAILAREGIHTPHLIATLLANIAEAQNYAGETAGVREALTRAVELLDGENEPPGSELRLAIDVARAHLDVREGRLEPALATLAKVELELAKDATGRDDLRRHVAQASIAALDRVGRVDEADARARETLTWLEGKGPELYAVFRSQLRERLANRGSTYAAGEAARPQ